MSKLSFRTTPSGAAMRMSSPRLTTKLIVMLTFSSSFFAFANPPIVNKIILMNTIAKRLAPKRRSAPCVAARSASAILMPAADSGGIRAAATATPAR